MLCDEATVVVVVVEEVCLQKLSHTQTQKDTERDLEDMMPLFKRKGCAW